MKRRLIILCVLMFAVPVWGDHHWTEEELNQAMRDTYFSNGMIREKGREPTAAEWHFYRTREELISKPPIQQWEYKQLCNPEKASEMLKWHGLEGWELISAMNVQKYTGMFGGNGFVSYQCYIFKRPKQ